MTERCMWGVDEEEGLYEYIYLASLSLVASEF